MSIFVIGIVCLAVCSSWLLVGRWVARHWEQRPLDAVDAAVQDHGSPSRQADTSLSVTSLA